MKARDVIRETIEQRRAARIDAGLRNALPKAVTIPDDDADAILAALAREGLAVVPVEPTEAMKRAGPSSRTDKVWRAMLAAARKETDHDE